MLEPVLASYHNCRKQAILPMRLAILLSFLGVLVVSAASVKDGIIRGTVLAYDGNPVSDAHVSAEVMRGSKVLTVLSTNTNAHGVFIFEGLETGEYHVSADKREAGYLSTRPDIFNDRQLLSVFLTADASMTSTIIRFAPKGATITGWVKDGATNRPISAHLSLAPVSGRGWSTTSVSARFPFSLLIPADKAIRFGACAEGYDPWFYADASNPSRRIPVQLSPGAELKINIKLEPSSHPPQPCMVGRY
jgi:carboxypeptidase family protein